MSYTQRVRPACWYNDTSLYCVLGVAMVSDTQKVLLDNYNIHNRYMKKRHCLLCGIEIEKQFTICENDWKRIQLSGISTSSGDFSQKVIGDKEEKGIIQSDRTFGVELECYVERTGDNTPDLNTLRYTAAYMMGKNHALGYDGSVGSRNGNPSTSTEVRTAILCGKDGERELSRVCSILKDTLHRVNNSCGTHCHIGIPEAKKANTDEEIEKRIKNLMLFYRVFEKGIRGLLPKDRRNNGYCKSFTSGCKDYIDIKKDKSLDGSIKEKGLSTCFGGRYGINFNALSEHGTVEIRYHEGTLDAQRLTHWIALHSAIVDTCMNGEITQEQILDMFVERQTTHINFQNLIALVRHRLLPATVENLIERFNVYLSLNKKILSKIGDIMLPKIREKPIAPIIKKTKSYEVVDTAELHY